METLNALSEFIRSPAGFWTLAGSAVWIIIGIVLFCKYFVMGLIGCTNKSDTPFVTIYTIGCIFLWPLYLLWLGGHILSGIDLRKLLHLPPKPVYLTCKGKGGKYKYIGIICCYPYNERPLEEEDHIVSIGAGTSKGEILKIYNLNQKGRLLMYTGFTEEQRNKRVYQDVKTGKYYHRTLPDFTKRMANY